MTNNFDRYKPLFAQEILQILETPFKLDSVVSTLRQDELYQELVKSNQLLAKIRHMQVMQMFSENCTELRESIKKDAEKITDTKLFCLVRSLLAII